MIIFNLVDRFSDCSFHSSFIISQTWVSRITPWFLGWNLNSSTTVIILRKINISIRYAASVLWKFTCYRQICNVIKRCPILKSHTVFGMPHIGILAIFIPNRWGYKNVMVRLYISTTYTILQQIGPRCIWFWIHSSNRVLAPRVFHHSRLLVWLTVFTNALDTSIFIYS